MNRYHLFTACLLITTGLLAKQENSSLISFGIEEQTERITSGDKSIDPGTGIIRTWRNVSVTPVGGDPESVAENFLQANRKRLGLFREESTPIFSYEKGSHGIFYEVYYQTINGIPVFRGDITVTVSRENRITFVRNNSRYYESISGQAPSFLKETAYQIAVDFVKAKDTIFWQKEPTLYYLVQNKTAYLVWLIEFESKEPLGSWQVFVDALSGEVRALDNRIVFADGQGMIWDPDPLSSAYTEYGDPGFSDFNDSDTDELNGERFVSELLDITFSGGIYSLEGPYVKVEDWDPPTVPVVTSTDPDSFYFTRSQSGFEDVLVYHFIDKSQRYIQSLGFNNVNNEDQTSDPHGVNGADNSYYFPGSDQLAWGEGGVDDAEDVDVILHEYGHAIQHDQVPSWGGGHEGAMGEGFGDYWAGSHSLTASAHHSNWVFNWDGNNDFWSGRILDAPYHYPENANGQVHDSGQLWSAGLWDIHTDPTMDREVIDALVLQHHFMIGSSALMADAAAALIQADLDMFNGEHYNLIVEKFGIRGFINPDDYPPMSNDLDPNPPSNLASFSDETMPTSIQLTWDDPTELFGGGEIGTFQINISRDDESITEVWEGIKSYLDEGLSEGQLYTYTLVTQLVANDSTSYPVHVMGFAGGYLCEKGHVNSDGVIDVFDVIKTVNIILGINENPTDQELCSSDYDDDGEVLVFDIIKIVNFILGIGMNKEMIVTDAVLHQVGDFLHLEADGPIAGLLFSIGDQKVWRLSKFPGWMLFCMKMEGKLWYWYSV